MRFTTRIHEFYELITKGGWLRKKNEAGNELYCTNSLIFLVKNLLYSKPYCQKGFNLIIVLCKYLVAPEIVARQPLLVMRLSKKKVQLAMKFTTQQILC